MAAPASLPRSYSSFRRCLFLVLALFATSLASAEKWPAIDKNELADPKPKIDPEAGAEILLREVTLDHSSFYGSEDTYYVRAKVYTKAGIDEFSKIELPYNSKTKIRYIAARTIKPDGTVVELNSKDIFDRVILKSGNTRTNIKSFALPALEPGCIVEYTYTEYTDGPGVFMSIYFQSSLPTRRVHYRVKLLKLDYDISRDYIVRSIRFNCPAQPLKADNNDWYHFEMSNLAAVKDEPFMPPAIHTRSSMMLYYAPIADQAPPAEYWGRISKNLYKALDETAKPTKAIRTTLATIVAPDDTDQVKLEKIYHFCRTKIVNRDSDASGLTNRQLEKLKANDDAHDVLKSGSGNQRDINRLFAALTRAAGLETQFAACNDRTIVIFDPVLTDVDVVLDDRVVAVRIGGNWQFFDPGSTYLPFGFVNWWNTDAYLLIGDKSGKGTPVTSPSIPADASYLRRQATLTLSDDGTLEGDVTVTYTGYEEVRQKRTLDGKTPEERDTHVRESMQDYQKSAEVTAIKVENATSPTEPLKITYHLRIPQYADATGSRLFFQPAVFQKGGTVWFDAKTRRNAILFSYRSASEDTVTIKLPDGYKFEQASAPEQPQLGDLGEYITSIKLARKTNTLIYHRKFKINSIGFQAKYYDAIKAAFDLIHLCDNHTLTLKAPEETPPPPATPAAAVEKPAAADKPAAAATAPAEQPAATASQP